MGFKNGMNKLILIKGFWVVVNDVLNNIVLKPTEELIICVEYKDIRFVKDKIN